MANSANNFPIHWNKININFWQRLITVLFYYIIIVWGKVIIIINNLPPRPQSIRFPVWSVRTQYYVKNVLWYIQREQVHKRLLLDAEKNFSNFIKFCFIFVLMLFYLVPPPFLPSPDCVFQYLLLLLFCIFVDKCDTDTLVW